jgi:MFS family permease
MPANGSTAPAPTPSAAGLQTALPGARATLILLLIVNLFNYIDRQVLSANLDDIEKTFLPHGGEYNGQLLGALALAFILSFMVFAPVFGWLASFLPRWKVVGAGVIVWSLASGASGLAPSFLALLITRCFVGIGEAAYGPVAPDMISDLYPVKARGSVLSVFYVAIPVGGALGYMLGGWAGWPWSFFLVVPPGLLLGLWCFFMPEPPRGLTDQVTHHRPPRLKDHLILLRTPSYVLVTLGMTMLMFSMGGIAHWMPYYVSEYRHAADKALANTYFGVILVVAGLTATVLGGLTADALRKRFPGSYFLVSGTAMLVAFPLFFACLYTPFPWAWILIFLACFCLFFNTGPTNAILANVSHPALRAQAFAFNIFFIHLFGDAISPYVIGGIADLYRVGDQKNMTAGFLAVSGAVLLGAILWLWGARYLERDTELAPTRLSQDSPPLDLPGGWQGGVPCNQVPAPEPRKDAATPSDADTSS